MSAKKEREVQLKSEKREATASLLGKRKTPPLKDRPAPLLNETAA